MADLGGNFINPAYASPQQIAAMREYAKTLLNPPPARHWAMGLGNIVQALVGGHEAHQADTEEQQANSALMAQLGGAIKSKDLSQIVSLAGNPRMTTGHMALLAALLEPRGQESYGPGATESAPGPSILDQSGNATAGGIPQGQRPPVASGSLPPPQSGMPNQPYNPNDISGNKMPPGQNITSGQVTGVDVQDIPQGTAPSTAVAQNIPPRLQKAIPTLDFLNQKDQQYKSTQAANMSAAEENKMAVTKGLIAKPKLDNLQQMFDLSQHLGDSGFVPRLQTAFKQATGVMPPPNASQYEIFDSLFKRLAPDAITAGRVPPALLEQYNQRGPEIWQDKDTRNAILHSIAMPIDLDVRAGKIASQADPSNPIVTQQRLYKLQPDRTPLGRPQPDQRHIQLLKQNPDKRGDFDAMFGPNSSDAVLGPQ